jgi:hypothetical protein
MMKPTPELLAYYASGKPLVCELDAEPYLCEFWPVEELATYNLEYQVPQYAPGYFGFATSGGGEMFALAPSGDVVCLPFIGMEPAVALPVASLWAAFEGMLRNASNSTVEGTLRDKAVHRPSL